MIRFKLTQVDPASESQLAGKYLPHTVIDETIDVVGLAQHMTQHNTPFSAGSIQGMIVDMVACIKELLLAGKNVKLPDLGIFSVGLECKPADSREDFSVAKHITSVKMRARATGELTRKALNLQATLREIDEYNGGAFQGGDNPDQPGGGAEGTRMFALSLSASPANGGTVSGAGNYEEGEEVEIKATPGSGYTFSRWSDGDTNATRTLTMTGDLSLTATFQTTQSGGGDEDDGGSLVG